MSRRWQAMDLLWILLVKELKVRYKSTLLGFVWSLANPILLALVLYVAFVHILRASTPNFLAFLLAGLFPWQWFASTVMAAPGVFLGNGDLIKKIRFPRALLPMALVGNHLIHFCLALAAGIVVMAFYGIYPSYAWVAGIPALLVIQSALLLGAALIISSLNVFLRDLEHIVAVLTQLLFFLTPIFYPESLIPEKMRVIYAFNPMAFLVTSWRSLMLEATLDGPAMGWAALWATALLALGYLGFRRVEWRFAECV